MPVFQTLVADYTEFAQMYIQYTVIAESLLYISIHISLAKESLSSHRVSHEICLPGTVGEGFLSG